MEKELDVDKDYLKYVHKETKEELFIEVSLDKREYKRIKRARKAARKFANFLRFNSPEYKLRHIVLTQEKEGFEPRFLNPLRNALKKRFGAMLDFWCAEIQHERLEKYGDAVLHWHLIVAVPESVDVSIEAIKRLWGRGNCYITSIRNRGIFSYVLKYITKDAELFQEKGARKFGGSRIATLYSLSLKQLEKVLRDAHFEWSTLEGLFWNDGKGYELLIDSDTQKQEKLKLYDVSFRKEWEYVGLLSGGPF